MSIYYAPPDSLKNKFFQLTEVQSEALRLLHDDPTRYVLLFGGSRSGKTFAAIYAMIVRAMDHAGSRHVILRHRFNAVKQSVFMDTLPKVIKLAFPECRYKENRSDWLIRMDNGSEIWIGGLDDKERVDKILGKEYATIYFNECSEISYHAVTTALTRLAQNCPDLSNKAFFDCNPPGKRHWSYRLFVEKIDPQSNQAVFRPNLYESMLLNPDSNRCNLPSGYLEETLAGLPERQRRRFMDGQWLDDVEGALWNRAMIDSGRVIHAPELVRIVVGVDPAVTATPNSDRTGIVTAGIDNKGEYYVLSDATMTAAGPSAWARKVQEEYQRWNADRVVGEVNNGGDLIAMNLRFSIPGLSFKSVRATRGKIVRAEPIAALYEQGKVHHVGTFNELEEEMCNYNPLTATRSPDHLDALVWALSELAGQTAGPHLISA